MFKKVLIIALLALSSCNSNDSENIDKGFELREPGFMGERYYENFLNDSLREVKLKNALSEGDTLAYCSVMADYNIGGYRDEFLFYAMLMAENHQFSTAYFDVFSGLDISLYGSLTSKNNLYRKVADYNLIKAWLKRDKSAFYAVKERFGEDYDSLRILKYLDKLEEHLIKETIEY